MSLKQEGAMSQQATDQPVIVRSKLEYHPVEDKQGELTTNSELAQWWLSSELASGSQIWVGQYRRVKFFFQVSGAQY